MLRLSVQYMDQVLLRRCMTYGIFLQCAYTAWVRGGVHPSLQWPVALVSAALCLLLLALPVAQRQKMCTCIWRDPLFRSGAVFLLILCIQWIHSGYHVFGSGRMPPKWLPWSFERSYAAEMLNWFFPVFVVLLAMRHILKRTDAKVLVYLLVWNGALLAFAGIIQDLLNSDNFLGIWDRSRSDSFASFDYPNHAAAWFYLHAVLAAGLAHDAEVKRKPRIRIAVLGACFMCCIAASCLTLSRVGAFIAMVQLAVVFAILLSRTRRNFKSTAAVNRYIVVGILALIGITLFFGAGKGRLAEEVGGKTLLGERSHVGDLTGRLEHLECAWAITRDFPVFGVGPWGCHALANLYLPGKELKSWMVNGRINVHCDPAQFLAEFGFAGGLCMAMVLVSLVQGVIGSRRGVLFYWITGGIVVVALHSLIDLPFRCPAILLTWCTLFAALPLLQKPRVSGDNAQSDP